MTKTGKILAAVLLLLSTLAFAQKRDPLTDAEADQLRQVAMEPQKRLKLFIKFTEARLDAAKLPSRIASVSRQMDMNLTAPPTRLKRLLSLNQADCFERFQ